MSFIPVKCPGCGYRCKVSANAPARITCGNCLTSIETGNIDHEGPVSVIPLDRVAGVDRKMITGLLLLSGGTLIGGSALAIFAGNSAVWCIILAAVAIVIGVVCGILLIRQLPRRAPVISPDPTPWRGGTLSYRSSIQPRRPSPLASVAIGLGIAILILLGIAFLLLGTCGMIMSNALNFR